MKNLVWLRQDLRLSDNPALYHAASQGELIVIYIYDTENPAQYKLGGASKWWLRHSLKSLIADFKKHDIQLIIKKGDPFKILTELIDAENITALYYNRCYEPFAIKRDTKIKQELAIEVNSYNASLLYEPWQIKNGQGQFFKVFTPFWKACLNFATPEEPLETPDLKAATHQQKSLTVNELDLLPKNPDWSVGFDKQWQVGEQAAQDKLHNFLDTGLKNYATERDLPAEVNGTSILSPHLHFGEISSRQIFQAVKFHEELHPAKDTSYSIKRYVAELGWREFSYYLLYHFKELPEQAFNKKFSNFPWQNDKNHLQAWRKGLTGYPIVDAGMRQLWQSGWMHNRVRMIVASFLTKHLLIDWRLGAEHFYDCLLDADLASNSASWQWVAGSGADAAPYFRIFNPIMQSKKFDSNGEYIKKWVPELAHLDTKYLHEPWLYEGELDYPKPLVEHFFARDRALQTYQKIK